VIVRDITELPAGFAMLANLKKVIFWDCYGLRLPSNLEVICLLL